MQEISVIGLVNRVAPDIGLNGREQLRVELASRTGRGERVKDTYFTVFLWQTFLADKIVPGVLIYVQGELRVRAYINKEGKATPALTIYGNNIFLIGTPEQLTEKQKEVGYVSRYERETDTLPKSLVESNNSSEPQEEDDDDGFFGTNDEYPF